jgi:succinate dehydrogenase / fumarate reductase cytochrome b subunit
MLFGWSFCLFYHLLNGVRHLAWDAGWGFELKEAYATGWAVVAGACVLTLAAWIAAYAVG